MLCDVIDLTSHTFAEKIPVAGCKPSRLGEASSAVFASAFHTPVNEERLAQVFLQHNCSVHKYGRLKVIEMLCSSFV